MSISSTESNRQPGIYAQYPQNGQFESNYVVHTSDTGRVVPSLLEGQVPPSPPPLRSNRFCCLRVMDRVGSCLANLCRKISRCFTAFLRGLTRFFKTLYCHVFSNGSSQIRNDQRIIPIEIPAPQPEIGIDEIEPLDQQEEPALPCWLNDFGKASRNEQINLLAMSSPQDQIRVLRNLRLPEGVDVPEEFECQLTNEITAIPVRDSCLSNKNQGCLFERTTVIHSISSSYQNSPYVQIACPFTRNAWKVNYVQVNGNLALTGLSELCRIDHPLQQRILHWLKEQHGIIPGNV